MHPLRKQRLMVVVFVVSFSSIAVGLVAYGLRGNINLFFPPADIVAGKAPVGQSIRMGGMVVEGMEKSDPASPAVGGETIRPEEILEDLLVQEEIEVGIRAPAEAPGRVGKEPRPAGAPSAAPSAAPARRVTPRPEPTARPGGKRPGPARPQTERPAPQVDESGRTR